MRFLKIPEYFLNSPQETMRYIMRNKAVEEDAEMIISSSIEEDQSSEEDKSPQLKICFYGASIVITLLIFCVALGVLYHSTNILQGSLVGSCVPLQGIKKVIVETEQTDLKSCSDNLSCHSFLDTIEQKHNGLKYNFVIGESGELYIGSGFSCLAHSDINALYVKMLRSKKLEPSEENNKKICFRLSEIINHGVLCGKISPEFEIQGSEKCNILESVKNKSYHVHDPDQEVKLIHGNFGWTFCGNLSSTLNIEKNRVITLESFSKNSCLPLQHVDTVTVDIVETPPYNCSDELSCLRLFEEHHEGLKYNFIIGHHHDVYVGLGYSCRVHDIPNVLKIKVLIPQGQENYNHFQGLIKYANVVEDGKVCGIVARNFAKEVNCNTSDQELCKSYQIYNTEYVWLDLNDKEIYNISSKNGRGVVPGHYKFDFCNDDVLLDNSTFDYTDYDCFGYY